jgi:hypothetical protein
MYMRSGLRGEARSELAAMLICAQQQIRKLGCFLLFSAALATSRLVFGQTARLPRSVPQQSPVSVAHLYWHFLIYQDHLDREATRLERKGKDGSWLRNNYQKKLGFTDAQFAPVRETATNLEKELDEIDAQVQKIVEATRAANPRVVKDPGDLPPVPKELLTLRDEHEAVIEREVAALRNKLGPERTARLETFLKEEIAPRVTIQHIAPPPLRKVPEGPASTFSKEGRP